MQCAKRASAFVVLWFAAGAVARAQAISGYTLQETVLVPVTGASVSSASSLAQGVQYKLRAMGSATVMVPTVGGLYREGDAEYGFGAGGFPFLPNQAGACAGGVDVGLAVNDPTSGVQKTPSWGAYNGAHVYTADFTGLGAPISLNYHDCTFAGNGGVLTVEIFRPMGMTLVTPTITDVSPGFDTFAWSTQHSVSGRANALAVAADGKRLYAGTFAGVWRSDDAGETWRQLTSPQPAAGAGTAAGALLVPDVYDIAISPSNPDVVMVAVESDTRLQPMNGIYRSEDGGNTWALVKRFACSNGGDVTQIVFAPDDANLVFAAGGCAIGISGNGGKTWTETVPPGATAVWHVAVAPGEPGVFKERAVVGGPVVVPPGVRRVYALGSNQMFYSTDGGQSWAADGGLSVLQPVGGEATSHNGNSSRVLMVEPGNNLHVLVVRAGLANGPSYYDLAACGAPANQPQFTDGITCNTGGRSCGEGSIWLGDFSGFLTADPSRHGAAWTQLPGPPTYWGVTSPSGNVYLDVVPVGTSFLVFFADLSHVHVSAGLPTAGGWHRIEGLDASQTAPPRPPNPYCNNLFVHADPHAMAMTANFSLTLQPVPAATPPPYNDNKVAAGGAVGDLWMANDGGVYHSSGALTSWRPAAGLATLATINVAGLAVKGLAPALYFGTGDNDDFYSVDGGASWQDPRGVCGDCDPWFADPAQVHQVMTFGGRITGGGFQVYTNSTKYPEVAANPPDDTVRSQWVCTTDCNALSPFSIRGYRPMVLTLANETAPATGDFLIIGTKSTGERVVFRKTNSVPIATPLDWEDASKAVQYGPVLPPCGTAAADCIDVVQAAGGHAAPTLYVGDPGAEAAGDRTHTMTLWKWSPGMQSWQQIVPSPAQTPAAKAAQSAQRFFADPFDPNTIYLLDAAAVKRSDDGGATWEVDAGLDNAVTENHQYSYTGDFSVIKDMVFVRGEDRTRFAIGNAGVYYTADGKTWIRLLSSSALPGHPVSAYFDNISDPCDPALYVALDGRGLLRIDPILAPSRLGSPVVPLCGGGVRLP